MNRIIKEISVPPSINVRQALTQMNLAGVGLLLILDGDQKLLGIVTDGDIRRGLIRGISLDAVITEVINSNFKYWPANKPVDAAITFLRASHRRHLPVLDKDLKLVDLILLDEIQFKTRENAVVLMVGGLGTRLRPLTDDSPKPMLKVGNKPFLESILENFISQGFRNFYFCVNYLAEKIIDYFGDGSNWGIKIKYTHEETPLGTAGALSLIHDAIIEPLIVMNGDLLTKIDFNNLLEHHYQEKNYASMCVRNYEIQIPYGVIETDGLYIKNITEKPIHNYLVNAGIYVLNPACIAMIPKEQYYDMPSLFRDLLQNNLQVGVFPIQDYWIDIGRSEDFEMAKQIFASEELKK